MSSTDLTDDGWDVDDMVVDREVEALAIVGSDAESRVTTGCVGGEGAGLKKGGPPQVSSCSTVQYNTVVYCTRLQHVYEPACVEARRNDLGG